MKTKSKVETSSRAYDFDGYRMLAASMIKLAIRDATRTPKGRFAIKNKRSALWWIYEGKEDDIISLFKCCAINNRHPAQVRRHIDKLTKEKK